MTVADIISSSLLELFVMGQTNESETAQVLQWKEAYPEVAQEIENIEIALEKYALANAVTPKQNVKELLFAKVASKQQNEIPVRVKALETQNENETANQVIVKPISNASTWKWMTAASFALLLGSTVSAIVYYNKYNHAKNELANISDDKIQTERQLDIVLTSNSQPIQLKGTPYSPASTAKIFWVKNTGDVYVAPSGLPEAPKGLQYQLWAIIDGKPVDGGMIIKSTKGGKYEIQKMKSFGNAQAFAITLEKEGGSPSPSMDKMYVIAQGI